MFQIAYVFVLHTHTRIRLYENCYRLIRNCWTFWRWRQSGSTICKFSFTISILKCNAICYMYLYYFQWVSFFESSYTTGNEIEKINICTKYICAECNANERWTITNQMSERVKKVRQILTNFTVYFIFIF